MNNDNSNKIILIPMIVNSVLGVTNRILQIIVYCLNRYKYNKYKFQISEVQQAALTFCIMPTAVNVFMMGLYCLFHQEEKMTVKIKIKNFFRYILSMEILFPLGVHRSLKTKFSYNADNPLITMRLVNAVHFMLVALPQLLIICINCSANDKFNGIESASLFFSCLFLLWSVGYYFICITFSDSYDDYITDYVEKSKDE